MEGILEIFATCSKISLERSTNFEKEIENSTNVLGFKAKSQSRIQKEPELIQTVQMQSVSPGPRFRISSFPE